MATRTVEDRRSTAQHPPEALFAEIAEKANGLAAVLAGLVDCGDMENATWMASAARSLANQIGWIADLGSAQFNDPGSRGGAMQWLLSPACLASNDFPAPAQLDEAGAKAGGRSALSDQCQETFALVVDVAYAINAICGAGMRSDLASEVTSIMACVEKLSKAVGPLFDDLSAHTEDSRTPLEDARQAVETTLVMSSAIERICAANASAAPALFGAVRGCLSMQSQKVGALNAALAAEQEKLTVPEEA